MNKREISENTIKFRANAKKQINTIMSDNNIDRKDYKKLFSELLKKYSLNTSFNYFRSGYLFNYLNEFNNDERDQINVFILNMVDSLNNEKIMKDKKINNKRLEDIRTDELNDHERNLINLYKIFPMRLNEFLSLKVYDNKPSIFDNQFNYIIKSERKLYINKSKTKKYDEIILRDDIMDAINNIIIDKHHNIYHLSPRSFQYLLSKLGTTTQEIRKLYAEEQPDKVYPSRILGHRLETHLKVYQKIK